MLSTARKAVAGLTFAAALAVPATAAFAAGTTDDSASPAAGATATSRVDVVKARCTTAVDRRFGRLDVLGGRLAAAAAVTDAHRATLTTALAGARTGLTSLRAEIQAASSTNALQPLCEQITSGYRVYALRTPQVDLAIRLDRATATTSALATRASSFQRRIEAAKAAGKDTTKAEAALAKLNAAIAAANTAGSGKADALVTLAPVDYNANHAVVSPFRAATRQVEVANRRAAAWAARTAVAVARLG